ncbi:MAG: bacteriohemerythrin [Nitrosomonas ureae]
MSLINWTHDLDTGIEWIDAQHKQIVNYINDLDDVKQAGEKAKVGEVMDGLIQYTVNHFSEEEKMMERAGYNLIDAHKGIHKRFIEKVNNIHNRYKMGNETTEELLNLLETWLFTHIRVNDHGYISSVKETGADKR